VLANQTAIYVIQKALVMSILIFFSKISELFATHIPTEDRAGYGLIQIKIKLEIHSSFKI
jgi:hypothetical protein